MSIRKQSIDKLLEATEMNPFLLCSIASKRSSDIENMIRSQHLRVAAVQDYDDITRDVAGESVVSYAMSEIESGVISYNQEVFDEQIKDEDTNN